MESEEAKPGTVPPGGNAGGSFVSLANGEPFEIQEADRVSYLYCHFNGPSVKKNREIKGENR